MVGDLYMQNDVENYFSEMARQLGWKPAPKMVEARARKTDWAVFAPGLKPALAVLL